MINPQLLQDTLLAQSTGVAPSPVPPVPVPPGMTAAQPVLQPYTSTTTTLGSDTSSTKKIMTPEYKTAASAATEGVQGEIQAQRDINAYEEQVRQEKADDAQRRLDEQNARIKAEQDAARARDESVSMAMQNHAAAREEMKGAEQGATLSLWDDMSTPRKVLASLFLGMGAAAASQGGPNGAFEIYKLNMDQDRQKRIRRLEIAREHEMRSTKDIELANKRYDERMKQVDNRLIAKNEQLKTFLEANIYKIPGAEAEGHKLLAKLQADEQLRLAQLRQDEAGSFTKSTKAPVQTEVVGSKPGSPASKPTESEAKLALLGRSMKDELEAIKKLPTLSTDDLSQVQKDTLRAEGADITSEKGGQLAAGAIGVGRDLGLVPKSRYSSLPEPKQKTLNAWDNAIEKYARMLTGAGMPAEEARRMARQNGPMAGDSPGVISSKLSRLEREAERMISLSGQAADARIAGTAPVQAPAQVDNRSAVLNARRDGTLKISKEDDEAMAQAEARRAKNPKDPAVEAFYQIMRNRIAQ